MAKGRYPINQSPFYKMVGIGQLERILAINTSNLSRLISTENYRVWTNKKGREIQQPIKWLAQVHKRIGNLLSRIEIPNYVYSQKGRSYADNAKQHIGDVPLGKTDITKFYPSTTRQMIWRMFVHQFKCARDVADILADICCYQQRHLPTGSSLSGRAALFAALPMFEQINSIAENTSSTMTAYVDDITLSGPAVTKKLISDIRQIVRRHGLRTKQSKTKTFSAHKPKIVTGAIVIGNEIRLPNPRHKKIWETRLAIKSAPSSERKALIRSLKGRLQEARQIINNIEPAEDIKT